VLSARWDDFTLTVSQGLVLLSETGGGGWTRTNDLRIMRPSL
jgi:hypothetical protein